MIYRTDLRQNVKSKYGEGLVIEVNFYSAEMFRFGYDNARYFMDSC